MTPLYGKTDMQIVSDDIEPGASAYLTLDDMPRRPNRAARRKAAARARGKIQKRVPFGRVIVTDLGDRVEYKHTTKGMVSRRTTVALLDQLIAVG